MKNREDKNNKEKLKTIKKSLKKVFNKLEKLDKNSFETAYEIGSELNKLKKKIKSLNQKWITYLKKHFQNFNIRTAQRYMKIAKYIDSEDLELFGVLGLTRVIALSNHLSKKEKMADFLKSVRIETNINLTDKKKVDQFIQHVENFLEGKSTTRPNTKGTGKNNVDEKKGGSSSKSDSQKGLQIPENFSSSLELTGLGLIGIIDCAIQDNQIPKEIDAKAILIMTLELQKRLKKLMAILTSK